MKSKEILEEIPEGKENAIRKQKLISNISADVSERTLEDKLKDIRGKWFVGTRHPTETEREEGCQRNEVLFYIDKNIENEKLKEKHTQELRELIEKLRKSLPEIKRQAVQKPKDDKPREVINEHWSGLRVKLGDLPDELTKVTRAFDTDSGKKEEPFYPEKYISDMDNLPYIGQPLEVENSPLFDDLKENHIPDIIRKYSRFKENCFNLIKEKIDKKGMIGYDRELIFEMASKVPSCFQNPDFKEDAEVVEEIAIEVTKEENIPTEGILSLLQEVKEDLEEAEGFVFYEDCPIIKKES